MPLTFVEPTGSKTLNVVLYGPEGSGKTWGALSAPPPILYLNAEGRGAVEDARQHHGADNIREAVVDSPRVLDDAELYLRDGGDGVKSVVLDSLSSVYQALVDHFSGGGKPSLPNYGDATLRIERFARFLRDVPQTVVLVAHEIALADAGTGSFERLPYTGSSNPALAVKVMAMADVVAYTARTEPTEANPEPRWLAQTVAGNGRRGKNRGDFLPSWLPVDIAGWVHLKQSAKPSVAGQAPAGVAA